MTEPPTNGTLWRLNDHDRRLDKIESLEPAVMRQEIRDVKDDIGEMRRDLTWVKRTFIGFCVTFAFTGVTFTIFLLQSIHHG